MIHPSAADQIIQVLDWIDKHGFGFWTSLWIAIALFRPVRLRTTIASKEDK